MCNIINTVISSVFENKSIFIIFMENPLYCILIEFLSNDK